MSTADETMSASVVFGEATDVTPAAAAGSEVADDEFEMCEKNICSELNIKLVDGLGDKVQSSSWLIK